MRFLLSAAVLALAGCNSREATPTPKAPMGAPAPPTAQIVGALPPLKSPASDTVPLNTSPRLGAAPPKPDVRAPAATWSPGLSNINQIPASGSQVVQGPSDNSASRDNVPLVIADISAELRASTTETAAISHQTAARQMAETLVQRIKTSPSKAVIYAQWSSAMHHIANAASFKAASFHAWNDADAQTKRLNMEAELQAAKGEAAATQQEIERARP